MEKSAIFVSAPQSGHVEGYALNSLVRDFGIVPGETAPPLLHGDDSVSSSVGIELASILRTDSAVSHQVYELTSRRPTCLNMIYPFPPDIIKFLEKALSETSRTKDLAARWEEVGRLLVVGREPFIDFLSGCDVARFRMPIEFNALDYADKLKKIEDRRPCRVI